jgi:hypothetical protein
LFNTEGVNLMGVSHQEKFPEKFARKCARACRNMQQLAEEIL